MKQCKVCGTLVHIDSNTCPSCGSHSFFVLDVKICPLCGKVNNITSSFCEQCGKQFVTAQGSAHINKIPQRTSGVYRERPLIKHDSYGAGEKDYEIEKPVIKSVKPYNAEENAADRAYKDFVALKPDIADKDDCSEYSYYVKGDKDKLPVIILPKFAKTQGKNILVNIIVNSDKDTASKDAAAVGAAVNSKAAEEKEDAAEIITQDNLDKVFTPYSVLESEENAAQNEETVSEAAAQTEAENSGEIIYDDGAVKENKAQRVKKAERAVSGKSVFASILMIITMLGLMASFAMVFYASDNAAYSTAGVSPVLHALTDLFKTNIPLPFAYDNGFAAFNGQYSGQFFQFKNIVPYVFLAIPVLSLFNVFVLIFTFRHRKWAKAFLVITCLFTVLCVAAAVLAIQFVYNSGFIRTLGLGLSVAAVLSVVNLILSAAAYKPKKA